MILGNTHSTDEGLAIDLCRTVLAAGPTDKAADLWKELRVAEKCRHGGGSYNLPGLVAELRAKFRLKEHPNCSRCSITAVESGYQHKEHAG
jgi:hypothetical protein